MVCYGMYICFDNASHVSLWKVVIFNKLHICCKGLPQFWYVLWLLQPGKVLCWRSCTGGGAGSNYRPQILIATGLLPQILIARGTKVVPRQHQFLQIIVLLIATFVYDMSLCNIYVGFRVYIKWFLWQQNTVFNLSWKYRIFATTMHIFSHWLSRYTMYRFKNSP